MGPFLWSEVPWHPVVPPATYCTSSVVNSRAPMRFRTRFYLVYFNIFCSFQVK
jgi:hypothetical protein